MRKTSNVDRINSFKSRYLKYNKSVREKTHKLRSTTSECQIECALMEILQRRYHGERHQTVPGR